jgi:protocatechuate 3,4-dioxygenase beta subunit
MLKPSDPALPFDGLTIVVGRENQRRSSGKVAGDGTFEIDNVPPGSGKLTLLVPHTSQWQPHAEMTVTVAEGKTVEGLAVPVEAAKGVKVSGRVVDEETGQGIPDFWLNVPSGNGFNTDKAGGYNFYARPGKVGVTIHGYGGPRGDYIVPGDGINRTATGQAGQAVTLEDIRLRKGKSLVVRVTDAAGRPVKGAAVRHEASETWLGRGQVTNARGEVTLKGLAPEATVRLSAQSKAGFAAPVAVDLKAAAATSEPVVLVVKPELAVRLSGRVLDDAGKPIKNASVQVSAMYERWGNYPATLKTGADGRFRSDALPPGANYSVKVQAPRHRTAASETWKSPADTGGAHDFGALRLVRQLGYVVGVVLDAGGKPVSGARVFNSGDADQRLQTTSDAQGRFRLEGLEKGFCYVAAEKPGHPLGLLRADAPAENVRLVLRPLVSAPVSPTLTAARERFALQVINQTIRETEGKKDREPDRQRIVDLLVPRDTLRATELALRTGQACRNSLSNDLGRLALARSVDEAIGCVRQVDHPFWRTRNFLDLAKAATPAQARKILPVAVASARGVPELMQQLYLLAECGDQMGRLKMPGAEALLRECAARAARLGVKEAEGYYRGLVGERLAEIDLDAGMALIASIQDNNERQRHLGNVAVRFAVRSPDKALQILESGVDSWQAQSAVARMCARLAATDPDGPKNCCRA